MDEGDEISQKRSKRLTHAQRMEMKTLWELGKITRKEISERYGISESAISQYFKRNGIIEASRVGEVGVAVTEAVKSSAVSTANTFESKRAARIEEVKERAFNQTSTINRMAIKIMVDYSKTGGGGLSEANNDLKALERITRVNAQTMNDLFKILGADTYLGKGDVPEIFLRDLTKEEVFRLQNSDGDDLDMSDLENIVSDDLVEEQD